MKLEQIRALHRAQSIETFRAVRSYWDGVFKGWVLCVDYVAYSRPHQTAQLTTFRNEIRRFVTLDTLLHTVEQIAEGRQYYLNVNLPQSYDHESTN